MIKSLFISSYSLDISYAVDILFHFSNNVHIRHAYPFALFCVIKSVEDHFPSVTQRVV